MIRHRLTMKQLDLKCRKNCVICEIHKTPEVPANPNANLPNPLIQATATTGTIFQINNAKLYVPIVTLSINDKVKVLENIKQEFKRTISWNKYRSEIITQPKNKNIDYLINPTFRNINILFLLSFKNGDNDPTRGSFDKYDIPSVEIQDFNALMMSRNDDYTTGNSLDFSYHQNYYKFIGIDLSRQTNTSIPQQISFVGKLEEDDKAKMFFIAEKHHKTILNFSLDSLIVAE